VGRIVGGGVMLQTHKEIPAQSTILNSQKGPEVVSNEAMGVWVRWTPLSRQKSLLV
jgi:hypothetical protein